MNIFKKCVPFVAFWVPTGKEKIVSCKIEVVASQFHLSAKLTQGGLTRYIPIDTKLAANVGEVFESAKLVEIARTGYALDENEELYVAPPKPDAPKVWRVVELY